MAISFWFDEWSGLPLAQLGPGQPRFHQPTISLGDAHHIAHFVAPRNDELWDICLTNDRDQIIWKWNAKGVYTAKSLYITMIRAGKIRWPFMEV